MVIDEIFPQKQPCHHIINTIDVFTPLQTIFQIIATQLLWVLLVIILKFATTLHFRAKT